MDDGGRPSGRTDVVQGSGLVFPVTVWTPVAIAPLEVPWG